jgi:hypothetical protein
MIDVSAQEGRVLAQFMYSELEKIAKIARNAKGAFTFLGETLPEITQAAMTAQRAHSNQAGFLRAGLDAPRLRDVPGAMFRQGGRSASMRKDIQQQLRKLDSMAESAKEAVDSLDPKVQAEGRELLAQIEQSRKMIAESAKPPKMAPAPKPPPAPTPKPPTMGQKFDRLANLTGKGVLGAGAAMGAMSLYNASKPQDPYSNYSR